MNNTQDSEQEEDSLSENTDEPMPMMPPAPNNTVENSPRPSRPLESRPKRMSLPPVQTDNISRTFQPNSIPETSNSNMSSNNRGGLHELNGLINTANFNREVERLKTFEGWRVPFLSAGQMAAAGFYYTKRDDVVRCAFCGVEVGCWEEGDNPMHDHQRWSPACRFLRKLPVGNVPINSENGPSENTTRDNGYDVCGTGQYGIVFRPENNAPYVDVPSIEKLGIQQSRPPAFPGCATYEARMRTYDMWPISLKLKPNVLSEAGFFYTGKGDQTICYHCGGGLKDWEESDEPWEEHARWFNKCNFVLLVKGKEFVDKVANKKPEDSKNAFNSNSSNSSERTSESTSNENKASTSATSESSSEKSVDVSGNDDDSINSNNSSDSRLCKICFQEEMGVLFLPCGHIVACPKCALSLTTCAVCRKPFSATIRAFLS